MTQITRTALFGKLNTIAYQSVESATVFCKMRGNPYVELVHWINQILQQQDSDLHHIVNRYELNQAKLSADMSQYLEKLPRGASKVSNFSSQLELAIERAWVHSTLMFGQSVICTAHLLVAVLKSEQLRKELLSISDEFSKIHIIDLCDHLSDVVKNSPEQSLETKDGSSLGSDFSSQQEGSSMMMGKEEAISQFTVDLTAQARDGKIDPVVGREDEMRQIIDVLMRRRQNNPLLAGEAGVGKTAVVEGFAQKIVDGDVPSELANVRLLSLDIGLLQAGASVKGEFENRLKQVIEEVQSAETPIILFIDEAHTLIGAGGAAGTGDAANLLKPALARGELRTIAATTWSEYKKYFEKDPALTRRFQAVKVEEPSKELAVMMMRGVVDKMEQHHKVHILDSALRAAVNLSHRYIPDRQLPDKAASLLDTVAARVAVSQRGLPAQLDESRATIHNLEKELEIIEQDGDIGVDIRERRDEVLLLLDDAKTEHVSLEARWQEEKSVVDKILSLRASIRSLEVSLGDEVDLLKAEEEKVNRLQSLQHELLSIQQDNPLILTTVDEEAVATVVQDWTGIPVGRLVKDEVSTVLNLSSVLADRIIGQDHALETIAKRIQTSRANLDNPNKPIGVFMLAGTSGVGKTETALALAETLYGGEQNLITINMSEFQEAHTVSTLKGAPPGYVGYGEGGVLTEAVRRKPHSVVLLDEVEKAHSDVHEIFFQVFDKGVMEDGEGRLIDFKNTLFLLTTNCGTEVIKTLCSDPEAKPTAGEISNALRQPLLQQFPAALLGRLVTIPYYPLSVSMLESITQLHLDRIKKRVETNHDIEFSYSQDTVGLVVSRCMEMDSGGRMIDNILTNTVLPAISERILKSLLENVAIKAVVLSVSNGEFSYLFDYDFGEAA